MKKIGDGMVDMAISSPEQGEATLTQPNASTKPVYPYGLSICLCGPELEKLNVDYSDWSVGDEFHLKALAKITSISEHETESGKNCRVELQIVALRGHDEEEEYDEYDDDED